VQPKERNRTFLDQQAIHLYFHMLVIAKMYISGKFFRSSAIAIALMVAMAASVAPQQQQDTTSVVMDSHGQMKTGLVRRHQEPETSAHSALEQDDKARQPDLYVLIGRNKCDGGGQWKYYELDAVTPGKYIGCSAACDAKDECVGFDVGDTGCNMYTQKAVPIGTWGGVRFKNADAFDGVGDHNKFASKPTDLTLGTTEWNANELYMCYRKTYYKPVESYYWLIGDGTCSGGGLWKRYKKSPADFDSCANACNQRDECIGFDVGTWAVTDSTTQVFQDQFATKLVTTTGCFMYTQKPVYGTWPSVQAVTTESGEGDHDAFPKAPSDLSVGTVGRYQAGDATGNPTKCYGKTHWVSLDQYYMELGTDRCTGGGGQWKYYKFSKNAEGTTVTLDECKTKCDEKDSCVGLDHKDGEECRLYSRIAVPPDSWHGVDSDSTVAFAGEGAHDKFPPTPFSLSAATGTGSKCLAKTHFETPGQELSEADNR